MARAQELEVKVAGAILSGLDRMSFDTDVFVVRMSMAPQVLKYKFIRLLIAFVDHEKQYWHTQSFHDGEADYYRDCATMSDLFSPFK